MNEACIPNDGTLVPRDALPLPHPYRPPATETEQRVEGIWRKVLSMDRIGMDDTYEDLGGDSFLASVIFELIEREFSIAVPLTAFAEAATIEMLATRIDAILSG